MDAVARGDRSLCLKHDYPQGWLREQNLLRGRKGDESTTDVRAVVLHHTL